MGERGGQKNPPGNRLKRPRRAAEESHRNRRRAVVPGRIALGKRVFSPKIQPLKRPTEAPRAHLPAAARICEAAMAPGRVIFLVRRECARGGREGGRIGGRAGCSKDGQRGLKRVEKGREIAAYLSILALNSSDFAEIRRHSRAAFRRGRRWFRRGGSGTARSGWSPMGEGSVRAGLCDRPFSRKIRIRGGGAFPNAPYGRLRAVSKPGRRRRRDDRPRVGSPGDASADPNSGAAMSCGTRRYFDILGGNEKMTRARALAGAGVDESADA